MANARRRLEAACAVTIDTLDWACARAIPCLLCGQRRLPFPTTKFREIREVEYTELADYPLPDGAVSTWAPVCEPDSWMSRYESPLSLAANS